MSANSSISTGLRNAQLVAAKAAVTGGKMLIFAGTIPASADASIGSATLLATVTGPSSAGLTFATTPVSGVLSKDPTQTWAVASAVAAGTATFFRLVAASDSGVLSTTEARIQGTVGVTGEGLNLTAGVAITIGQTFGVDSWAYEIPTY